MENWTVKSVDGVDVGATEVQEAQTEAPTAQETEQAVVEEATKDKPSVQIEDDGVIKVNLDQPLKTEEDAVQQVQGETEEGVLRDERVEPTNETQEAADEGSPIEIVSEEKTEEVNETSDANAAGLEQQPEATDAAPQQEEVPQAKLPENIQKLVEFMEETGGSLEDYVSLNKDYSQMDDVSLVREYYKNKYPHYSEERLSRRLDKEFLFDQETDDPDRIQDKKDAFEDAVYDAKAYLEDRKGKYYEELKFNRRNDIPEDYQKAYELAQDYTKANETNKQLQDKFLSETDKVFNQEFKGFDFKVGDNTYRYKVADPQKTKEYQSDINNFIGDYLGEDGSIADASGYHKAMFAAKNIDKIAQHFYEQGRAEALKQSAREAKNIDMDPRQDMSANVTTKSGTKVKVVSNDGFDGKLKFRHYNNR